MPKSPAANALLITDKRLDTKFFRGLLSKNLEQLSLINCDFDESNLEILGDMRNLQYFYLEGVFAGHGLCHLEHTPIQALGLRSPILRSDQLAFIAACRQLRSLQLSFIGLRLSDVHFLGTCDELRALELGYSMFDGDLPVWLRSLHQLSDLGLARCALGTQSGTRFDGTPLWSAPRKPNAEDALRVLQALATLRRLERLDLSDWPLADSSLDDLARLDRNIALTLLYTKITQEGIERLRGLRDGAVIDKATGWSRWSLRDSYQRWLPKS